MLGLLEFMPQFAWWCLISKDNFYFLFFYVLEFGFYI